jgi:dTDP-4-dehydrorhamnose reductase
MQRLMRERDALSIVDDQFGAPTWCHTIAQVTSTVLAKLPENRKARSSLSGVYHLAAGGSTSWFGFATAIRDNLGLNCNLNPIPASEYPTPATRPVNSRMSTAKLQGTFGLLLPDWEHDLGLCLGEARS